MLKGMESDKEVIVITGSSGLIGSAVVRRLAGTYRIAAFDKAGAPHPPPMVEAINVDLTSDSSMDYAFERLRIGYGTHIASVVHLAAYYDFSGGSSPLYQEINVRGTERVLNELRTFQVEQFLYSSTMLVHAPCEPGQRINEDWPIQPKWAYPESKTQAERILLEKHGAMPVVLQRIAGVYDDTGHSIPLANQIARIYERRLTSRLYPGDISRGQAFVHLDDVVDAIVLAIEQRKKLPPEFPVLIGEGETLSYDELQRTFGQLVHKEEWETRRIPKVVAKTGAWLEDLLPGEDPFIKPWMINLADDHYALDIARAKLKTGWQPKRSLRQTLPLMTKALLDDPPRWYRANKLPMPARLSADAFASASR